MKSPHPLALLAGLCSVAAVPASAVEKPNIVFILADDLGYADIGPMGAKDIATPNLDRIAAEGVKLTDFHSNAPVCSPTRCGFITGRWQQRVGFEWALGFSAESEKLVEGEWIKPTDMHGAIGLPATTPGIAKMLRSGGYATGAFGKWHLGFADEYNPLHHGFDEYFGELLGHADYYRHDYYDGTHALRDGLDPVKKEGYLTDLINERAAAFVKKHAAAERPFFCYVPHLAVHAPFQPPGRPEPAVTKANMYDGSRAIYAAMVEKIDEGVGMILAELEAAGVAEDTLIVFSSDNGGERWSDNRPLFHHKATLWEGGIRVPCLMRWPARLPKGKESAQLGITMDLTATFAAAAGVTPPEGHVFDGIDLVPFLTGEAPAAERTLFWRIDRSNRKMRVVRQGKWKYLDDGGTMDLLFDLEADLGERHNLHYTHPEIVTDLKERLAAWEAEMEREPKTFRVR
jgi:arylsulfatase A